MRELALLIAVFITLGLAQAQTAAPPDHDAHYPAAEASTGEVRRVDHDAQKVTLRHGPIPNLEMPEMTMVFRVNDPKLLEGLRPGDKVRFKAEKIGGQYTVTELVVAR